MALRDYSQSAVGAATNSLKQNATEIDTVAATLALASDVLRRLNGLAERLAGPTPGPDECGEDGAPEYMGVIPNLARSARSLDDQMNWAVESLNRIERLI